MKTTVNTPNPYQITWAVLTPIKGKVTKKDLTTLYRAGVYTYCKRVGFNEVTAHFPTKERALQVLKGIKGLTRTYEVVLITDKQFGLTDWKESVKIVATKKQLQNRIFI